MQKVFWLILAVSFFYGLRAPAQQPEGTALASPDSMAAFLYKKAVSSNEKQLGPALEYADSLEQLAEKLNKPELLYIAYKLKGDLYYLSGSYRQAVFWLKAALEQAKIMADTPGVVKVYSKLGEVYQQKGAPDKALENYLQAAALAENVFDPAQKAAVFINLGLVYQELGQHKEAQSYLMKALKLVKGGKDRSRLGLVHTHLGSLYLKEGDTEKASEHLKQARKIFEGLGDERKLADVLNEFSFLYLKDNPEISLEYLGLAHKLYAKVQDNAGLFEVYKNTGEAHMNQANYETAFRYLNLALDYADRIENKLFKAEVFLKLARLYELQQDFEKANEFYRTYISLEKGLIKQKQVNSAAISRTSLELNQKNEKIRQLEKQVDSTYSEMHFRQIALWLMAFLLLLLLALSMFYLRKLRIASRLNRLLKNKNQLIQSQKEEMWRQHQEISEKQAELENANRVSEAYLLEFMKIKDQLEVKVNKRTRELEELYEKLSFYMSNTPLAVLEWNSRLELTHWPAQAEAIFGYKAEEVLGLKMDEVPFVLPAGRKELKEIVEKLCAGKGGGQHFSNKSIHRFGKPLFIEWNFSVLQNEEGELDSVLSMANDVTLREQTVLDLKESNRELDTFLYKSSHDLRGPIARMKGIMSLGMMESKDEQAHLYFNMLNKVTDEFNILLLRLLMVHNINQHNFKEEKLRFAAFVDRLVEDHFSKKASFERVIVLNKVSEDLVVSSDGTLLALVLENLLENGMMFADNFNPVIEVEAVYLPSGKYLISLSDNGLGIPAEYHEKVFDMFFQGSTRSTGTGLGLYMVRKAVKKMGGTIRLTSENGQTTFEISLPAVKAKNPVEVNVLN